MKNIRLIIVMALAVSISSSCLREVFCEEGEGDLLTETIEMEAFTGINLMENADVRITQGPIQKVVVEARENIMDRLVTEVNGGVWAINLGRDCYQNLHLDIEITMPTIEEIHLTSAGSIIVGDFTGLGNVDMSIEGSGKIEVGAFIGTKDLDADISGSGEILATAEFPDLEKLRIEMSGSGNFDGFPMKTKELEARITGRGDIFATVTENLDIRITGSGDMHYKGNPLIDASITGSGKIINEN